jgi:predicted permease
MVSAKQSLRQLVHRPGLAIAVIGMLAVGIGATTAIYSLTYQVLLEPLPVPEPEQLVELKVEGNRQNGGRVGIAYGNVNALFSYPMLRDLEDDQDVFAGIAGHADFLANMQSGTESQAGTGALVSGSYFDVLRVRPALGRLIGMQDEPAFGESPVVVLGYDYWQNVLGGDRNILGDTLIVNNQVLTVIGVAPEGFDGAMNGSSPDVFVPLTLRSLMQPEENRAGSLNRLYNWVYVIARLRPDLSFDLTLERINQLYRSIVAERDAPLIDQFLDEAQMELFLAHGLSLESAGRGQGAAQVSASNPLMLLLGATALVLLIVCVNITSLLLARGAARAGELAIRASIGANRSRLMAQLLGESAAYALVGAVLALPVALITLRIIYAMGPPALTSQFSPSLDAQALSFAVAAAIATTLLFGLLPAVRASNTDPGAVIKGQSGQPAGGRRLARFRGTLIGMQIALSTVLLVLAGLFTLSLANVSREDLGMDLGSTVMFAVQARFGYEGERLDALYSRIMEELESQPGVVSVSSAPIPLLANFAFSGQVDSIRGVALEGQARVVQSHPWIGPGFFETLSIPVLAGRDFTLSDSEPGRSVAIVNQAFLDRFNLGRDVVGQRIDLFPSYYAGGSTEIIGVTGDARINSVKGDLPAQMFTPRARGDGSFSSFVFYVRGTIDPNDLVGMVRPVMAGIDPNLPVSQLQTLTERLRGHIYQDRLIAMLSTVFAALATVLAAVGLYAVLSYNISGRTRELGLRLALGANPARLLTMVLTQVGWIAAIAIALGLAAAFGVGRLADALLYELSGTNPTVFVAAAVMIALIALAAGFLPALRASRVAPMEALREQ